MKILLAWCIIDVIDQLERMREEREVTMMSPAVLVLVETLRVL